MSKKARFGSKAYMSMRRKPNCFHVVLVHLVRRAFINYRSSVKGLEAEIEGIGIRTFSDNERVVIWRSSEPLKVVLWRLGLEIFGKLRKRLTARAKLLHGPCIW